MIKDEGMPTEREREMMKLIAELVASTIRINSENEELRKGAAELSVLVRESLRDLQ